MVRTLLLFVAAAATVAPPNQDLATLRKTLARSGSVPERLEALDSIAALHSGGDVGVTVTAAVVSALRDDSFLVRARAAELLGGGLDAETAIAGLAQAASRFGRDRKALVDARKDLPDLPELGKAEKKQYLEELDAFREALEAYTERLGDWGAYRVALVAALASRPDDRCVEELGDVLAAQAVGEDADAALDALLAFGTAPALDHVLGSVGAFEETLRGREKHRERLSGQRPGKRPSYWKGTTDSWKEREAKRIAGLVERFDEGTATIEEWGRGFRERLRTFAERKGLEVPPDELVPFREWKSWGKGARETLPTGLRD